MILYLQNLWTLFVDMSFYIVIGLIFTGLLHAFVNKDVVLKHVGDEDVSSVVKASVLGVPLPLCSCGVVPTAMYLGKNGASKGAVVSFLTSTPQTGIDSIIATYGMMGPLFAVYRAVAAFISGIIAGTCANIFGKGETMTYDPQVSSCCGSEKESGSSCCGEKIEEESPSCCSGKVIVESPSCCSGKSGPETSSCCSQDKHETKDGDRTSFIGKIKIAISYGFGSFLDDIAIHFLVGLLIAALIATLVPAELLSDFGNPLLTMFTMVVVGLPMYICSTASIPIAVSLMVKGISPGGAFVFLFAGPITNMASLVILMKTLGKKVTAIYLLSAAACAILFGFILDMFIQAVDYTGIEELLCHDHGHETPIYMTGVAVVFGGFLIKSLLRKIKKYK